MGETSPNLPSYHLSTPCLFSYFPLLLFILFISSCNIWLNVTCVTPLGYHMASYDHATCHLTPYASKNVKFKLSWNATKFDVVSRFCETISMVKFVSSSEIYKNFGFLTRITVLPFLRKIEFSRVLHSSPLKRISSRNSTHIGINSHAYAMYTISCM